MFRRALALLLCSVMLVGSLPKTSFAAENVETTKTALEETETTESEEPSKVEEVSKAEVNSDASEEKTEIVTEVETVTEEKTETETVTETTTETVTETTTKTEIVTEAESVTEVGTVTETTTESEETTIVETEETTEVETTEVMTEETTEVETEETMEVENAAGETLGNSAITLSNVKATYNSISFDYKEKENYVQYVIISDSKDSNDFYLSSTSGSVTLGGLNPATEYKIYFANGYYDKPAAAYYEFSKTTAECPYNVEYSHTSDAADNIKLTAKITAKEGAEYKLPDKFYLNYKGYNAEGKSIGDGRDYVIVSSLPVEITKNIYFDEEYMFGNTEYPVDLWISESLDYSADCRLGSTEFSKESKTVKTAASVVSEVSFEYTPNTQDASKIDYTIKTGSYTQSIDGMLFYRLKGSNEYWERKYFHTENGVVTGSIEDLSIGATYEYLINAAGFKKEGDFTSGEARLKWTMSHDVGALDDVVTFAIDKTTVLEGAKYFVEAFYKPHRMDWWEYSFDPKEENDLTYTYVNHSAWTPNTEYDIKIVIVEILEDGIEDRTNYYTAFETVTTKASALKTTNTNTYIDGIRCDVTFDSSVRLENLEDDVYLGYPYIKNEDGKYTRLSENYVYLDYYDDWKTLCEISGLESNKAYEVVLGYIGEDDGVFYEYGTITFKTQADDRAFTIQTPEIGVTAAKIKGERQGKARTFDGDAGIILYYKESGTEKWKNYEYAKFDWDEETGEQSNTFTISVAGLESGKSYDYIVGIGDSRLGADKLKNPKTGTIKLKADERSVEITETESLLDGVVVRAKLSGNYIDEYNRAYMFYREDGKADAPWDTLCINFYDGNKDAYEIITTYNGEALKSGMKYVYKLCMEGKIPEKVEDYVKLEDGGEFTYTQPADDRTLEIGEVKGTRTTADFALTLKGESKAMRNYVTIFYREKGSEIWKRNSIMWAWNDSQPTRNIRISALTGDKEYEYTVGISNEYIYSVDDIVIGRTTGTFATKDERKLGEPVITKGYSYADFEVEVDGLAANDGTTYVRLYTKDKAVQNASWISQGLSYVSIYDNTASYNIKNLQPGKTYDYALVIPDNTRDINPSSEEYKKLPEARKSEGTFETKKSEYKLDIVQNPDKSVFNKAILDLTVTSTAAFQEKNFDVSLIVRENETNDLMYNGNISLNSVDYKAEAIITSLSEKTKYDITATLYAKVIKNDTVIREAVATTETSFITKGVEVPTELKTNVEELWLNSWNPDYQSYDVDRISIIVPDGTSNAVTWSSSDPKVAFVNNGYVYAEKPGEATITATSALNPSVKAEVKVHVKNYGVVFTDTKTPSKYNSVYTLKNTYSENIAYAAITDDGTHFDEVKATGTSDNPNIAYWDEEKQCIVAKNVGFAWIVLEAENFKTDLRVTIYADSPDFDLKVEDNYYYPALEKDTNRYQIALGQNYSVLAVANPETLDYNINDVLTFTSSDKTILTVNDYGYVKGLKKGEATVTVAYDMKKIQELAKDPYAASELKVLKELAEQKEEDLKAKTKTVTFDVRPLYSQGLPQANAITNVHKTLKDIALGEGWTWRDPETPLYALPGSDDYYEFEAEYTGDVYYNYEGTVKVYISTITGVDVRNNDSNVISSDGTDSMNLIVEPIVYGYDRLAEGTDYEISFSDPNVAIAQETAGYKVTASKKGKYTLKPEIKVGGTVVATGSYAITVVDGKLIDHIDLEPVADDKNVSIVGDTIYFDSNAGVANFKLKATAYDRKEEVDSTTKLAWSITDKAVADIDAKTSDREVTVKIKGEGHAVLQVTAGDEAKTTAQFKLEVRNYKPRVEGEKVTINTAYDYTSWAGKELSATQYGYVSVASVYEGNIINAQVVTADFKADYYDSKEGSKNNVEEQYVIVPTNPDMAAGKYSVELAVTTEAGFTYTYPLEITVVNKVPKVSAKISNTMNLFYFSDKGYLDVTLEKNKSKNSDFAIESLKFEKNAADGFKFDKYPSYLIKTPNVKRYFIDGSKVKVSDGKLVDASVASNTVIIKLRGVRTTYNLPVTVKYSYKKPKLTTSDRQSKKNVSTIVPSITGGKSGIFSIVADKTTLNYIGDSSSISYTWQYNERRCKDENVTVKTYNKDSKYISFTYSGEEKQFDIPLTIDSYNWREALTVTHKVKAVEPTAVLSNAKLTYNTNYNSEVLTVVTLKDYPYAILSAVDVVGADAASQELLTSNKLEMEDIGAGYVTTKLNTSKLGGQAPKKASYILTPYYYDAATETNKALNTVKLDITFTNKKVTAKISGKGKIDLAINEGEGSDNFYDWLNTNSIAVTPKFADLGSGYSIIDAKLTGEYSKYFEVYTGYDSKGKYADYIKISPEARGKLKAGQNYNLSMTYTLEDAGENRITVKSSNVLKVKPIQKVPKITVVGDNKILYAASDIYRTCEIRAPYSYYSAGGVKEYYIIESAKGSLDTNKDGKPDIQVTTYDIDEGVAFLKIKLTDKDAIVADAKGKAYTVPVTVKLVGRDGISKDAVVSIKVRVKK